MTDAAIMNVSDVVGRVEVCQKSSSSCSRDSVKERVRSFLADTVERQKHVSEIVLQQFNDAFLDQCIDSVTIYDLSAAVEAVDVQKLDIYVYQLHDSHEEVEQLDSGDSESYAASHWLLPSTYFHGLWESLVYDDNVKNNLLQYARTTLLFADSNVDVNIVSWNRLILLHGPPGTGKTSLCKALAQKLSIVLQDRYKYTQLVEINSHSLFSKWFSESGKLVMKMFGKIQEYLSNPEVLVVLLIDEVESLSAARQSVSANEPLDSIRVVNALLTQLDAIKRHSNVLILTTSNITGVIDLAFLDRADVRQYIGLPSAAAVYQILHSCIQELIRTKLVVVGNDQLLDQQALQWCTDSTERHESRVLTLSRQLQKIAGEAVGLSGRSLRKLPFLAYALHVKSSVVEVGEFLSALQLAVRRQLSDTLPHPGSAAAKSGHTDSLCNGDHRP